MLNFQQIDESGKTKNIKAEVVGVMEEGTNVIGHDFGQGQILQNDYRDIYSTYRYEQEKSVLILIGEQRQKKMVLPIHLIRIILSCIRMI